MKNPTEKDLSKNSDAAMSLSDVCQDLDIP